MSEHHGLYRKVSRNPNLLENAVDREPFHEIQQQQLGQISWEIAADALAANIDRWVERYLEREAHGEGLSELGEVAYAATIAQIETVLIAENARVEGAIDAGTGRIEYGAAGDARTDDVLDDIAEYVVRFEGDVRFVPDDRMPTRTGVAAILRFAVSPA